ncbi:hypothetical protein GDO81_025665 [Engystomops pustulosus]|uniref:Uncharacterized protein n=1 Tax=Engystomops pustulosus TaxID=76066 RepID=A0AAV6YH52_ENGPU|nr:hypothetical protein GDO81_025665 [Engystomops pustulosus]
MSTRCRCCAEIRRSFPEFTILSWVQVSACQATNIFLKTQRFFRIRWFFRRPRPPISVTCMPAPMRLNPITCAKNPGQFGANQ